MTPRPIAAAALAAASVLLAACGHGTHSAAARASAAATSTAVRADEKTAEALVRPCLPADQAALLAKPGRAAFTACMKIAPGKRQAAEACVLTAAEHDVNLTSGKSARKAGEAKLTRDAAVCAEHAR